MALKSIISRKQSKVEKLKQQVADLQQQVQEFKQYAVSGKAYPVHDNAAPKAPSKKLSHELRRAMVRKGNSYCTMYNNILNHRKEPYEQRMVYINPSSTKELMISSGSYGIVYDGNRIVLDPNPGVNDATVSVRVSGGAYMTMPVKIKSNTETGYYSISRNGKSIVIDLKTAINPLTGNLISR